MGLLNPLDCMCSENAMVLAWMIESLSSVSLIWTGQLDWSDQTDLA